MSFLDEDFSIKIAEIDEQIKSMQQELLATVNLNNAGDELGMEIRKLRDEKLALQTQQASRQDMRYEWMKWWNDEFL